MLNEVWDERGYTESWFARQPPELALTIRLCATRLAQHDLWRFVKHEAGSEIGKMHAIVTDVAALKTALRALPFAFGGGGADGAWDAAERTFGLSVHIKHFAGWPDDKVQVHIDRVALWLPPVWWWCPPVPLAQMVRHWWHYNSYLDVAALVAIHNENGPARGGPESIES